MSTYGGESRPIGVPQQQVNTVDYHFVSPHLASETKREFQRGYANDPAFKHQWSKGTETEKFVKHNGLLYFRQKKGETIYRLCVPKSKKLRTNVIMECHDGETSAHPGGRRTYLKAAQWYYWPTMDKDIRDSQKKKGLLMPIPTPNESWEVVSMDFITGLPASEGYDAIFDIVDKLPKRPKHAPTYSTADAKDTANVFFDAVIRHHGLPKVIISDRDSKAQADGQTERQNLVLEDALRCMVSYHGDDWVKHLGTIEYAHSTLVNASTKMTPFEVDTGRKVSNLLTERMKELVYSESDGIIAEFAKNFARERQEVVEQAQENKKHAQERQKEYYDRKRRQVVFKEGDLVLLDTKNLPLKTVNKNTELKKAKLAAKKVGPFVIERMINDNVAKLILPATMKRLNPTQIKTLDEHMIEENIAHQESEQLMIEPATRIPAMRVTRFKNKKQWADAYKDATLKCWSCGMSFKGTPCFIPRQIRNTASGKEYDTIGLFCGLACSYTFLKSQACFIKDKTYSDKLSMLKMLYTQFYGKRITEFKEAPYIYDITYYGGHIDICEYRNALRQINAAMLAEANVFFVYRMRTFREMEQYRDADCVQVNSNLNSIVQPLVMRVVDINHGAKTRDTSITEKAVALKKTLTATDAEIKDAIANDRVVTLIEYQMNANHGSNAIFNMIMYHFAGSYPVEVVKPSWKNTIALHPQLSLAIFLGMSSSNYIANKRHTKFNMIYLLTATDQMHMIDGIANKNEDDIADTLCKGIGVSQESQGCLSGDFSF
ncbi:Polyprotein [Phytophthora palmivora]|uniref:Polyprotein n=1 Tax=Phytophthora palmivora TaxID=4796 RepID=A0A2P4XT98_9STRA|nr:Polyprotein [Phytophthora palmivora]